MKKFLAGSATAMIFTTGDKLIGVSTTQINNSITFSVQNEEIRSGYGAALDYIYYHSSSLEGQLEDSRWDLDYVAQNIGADVETGGIYYTNKSLTITDGKIPVASFKEYDYDDSEGAQNYFWASYKDKSYTLSLKKNGTDYDVSVVTGGVISELEKVKVCYKYINNGGSESRYVRIKSDFVPSVVKLVLEAKLFTSDGNADSVKSSSEAGKVQFIIPRAQLNGGQEISMTSTGVSSTPLSYMALKADDIIAEETGEECVSASGVYGYIVEIENKKEWYKDIKMLAIEAEGDSIPSASLTEGAQLTTYAITNDSTFVVKPANRLTYEVTGGAGKLNTDGVVTTAFTGDEKITVKLVVGSETLHSDTATVKKSTPAAGA